jgi:hypothetical protein
MMQIPEALVFGRFVLPPNNLRPKISVTGDFQICYVLYPDVYLILLFLPES